MVITKKERNSYMKGFIFSVLFVLSMVPAFSQQTPIYVGSTSKYVTELGLVFPGKPDEIKNYVNANGINVSPLTSGLNSGFQFGRHRIINDQATLGLVVAGNAFFTSSSVKNQIYQIGTFLTGRLYFGDNWRNGLFAEVASGPEFAAASIQGGDFQLQVNVASRVGVGYNHQFSKDVTLGISFVASPSLTSSDYLNGSKVVVNMLW
jgi:hypothetical protein